MAYLKPFNINTNDIQFLIDQVTFQPLFRKDASGNLVAVIAWDGAGAIYDQHGNALWNGVLGSLPGTTTAADAALTFGTSYSTTNDAAGLRQVSGNFNNLVPGQQFWGAVDQPFARMAQADYAHYVQEDLSGGPIVTEISILTGTPVATDSAHIDHVIPVTPTLSITYQTFDRTSTETTTTTSITDGHHFVATTTEVDTSVRTKLDGYVVDATGSHLATEGTWTAPM